MSDDLDKILQQVQARVAQRITPTEVLSDAEKTRRGLLKLFSPVAEVLMKLRQRGITGYGGTQMPLEEDTIQAVRRMTSPEVTVQLAPDTRLVIRVTYKPTLTYPDAVTQAKWRLQVVARGNVCDEVMVDNRDVMAAWIMERVVSYHSTGNVSRHSQEIPFEGTAFAMDVEDNGLDVEDVEPQPEREASRHYRNISLDDDEGEE